MAVLSRSPDPDRPNRVDALLTLRGLACLAVVVAHCAPPRASWQWGAIDLSWLLFAPGGVAVRVFFGLSGYLMGKGFYTGRYRCDRPGIGRYLQNRATRILPLYYAAVLLSAIAAYPHSLQPENWHYLGRLLTFTYEHSLPIAFNAPLWSLSTEVQFYAIVPLVFWLSRRFLKTGRSVWRAMAIVAIGLAAYRLGMFELIQWLRGSTENNPDFIRYIYTLMPANLDAFLVGFWLNPLLQTQTATQSPAIASPTDWGARCSSPLSGRGWGWPTQRAIAITLMIGLYLICAAWKYQGSDWVLLVAPTLTVLVTGWFIAAFEGDRYLSSSHNRPLSRSTLRQNPRRAWEILGVLSFGIYVWHYPLLHLIGPAIAAQAAAQSLSPIATYGLRLAAVLGGSIGLAGLTYWAIERPAMAWRRRP
ncbi:MAG: acyltransferase [Oscillatoriales cyanobacterium]|nr:MAG: acyltransferase [Oscillatoriales cyanobacterium]